MKFKPTGKDLKFGYLTCIFASSCRLHGDCYDVFGFLLKFMILYSNESENWEHFQFSLIERQI